MIELIISAILGSIIGLERQIHKHDAGLRTFTLVCIGSTLASIMSSNFDSGDPGRISAQVVAGISFLGAGIIIHNQDKISGLTTAASIWVCAIIGLTVGAHLYTEAIVTTLLVIILLTVFNKLK